MMARSLGQNQKLASASFANFQFWTERKRPYCMHLKSSNGSTLLDVRVLQGGLQAGKSSWALEQNKLGLQYKSPNWSRKKMRMIFSNFSKNTNGFLHKVETCASTDISKHLEEFLKEYLNRLQCKNAYWTRFEKLMQSSKSPITKRYSCIKVMWKPHMTSPNFGENFKSIYQMVAVQKGLQIYEISFKSITLRKNDYANKSTDKELFL